MKKHGLRKRDASDFPLGSARREENEQRCEELKYLATPFILL
jgi:hypothetical protein